MDDTNQELEIIILYDIGLTQNRAKVGVIHELPLRNNQGFSYILRKSYDTVESLTLTPEELGYPADFFRETAGKWEGEPLIRGEQGVCDHRNWDLL
ncbi:hypothetical protein [Cuspidothrix issatschenkoi]|uniref:Uncharacterized protein n=1 Tax=Cuspidothrix issatschenkoi CHARLIE-1 TaxID=2052836 RepID=A0A2S6CUV5_9CYAN|nr:hypothetical protein [Cuspidothrix issatschenkoi]PPJ63482.1 hypothetical protein CUN59_09705 [Cuspidothrix issatschenkoi CHARLIE-1]